MGLKWSRKRYFMTNVWDIHEVQNFSKWSGLEKSPGLTRAVSYNNMYQPANSSKACLSDRTHISETVGDSKNDIRNRRRFYLRRFLPIPPHHIVQTSSQLQVWWKQCQASLTRHCTPRRWWKKNLGVLGSFSNLTS